MDVNTNSVDNFYFDKLACIWYNGHKLFLNQGNACQKALAIQSDTS